MCKWAIWNSQNRTVSWKMSTKTLGILDTLLSLCYWVCVSKYTVKKNGTRFLFFQIEQVPKHHIFDSLRFYLKRLHYKVIDISKEKPLREHPAKANAVFCSFSKVISSLPTFSHATSKSVLFVFWVTLQTNRQTQATFLIAQSRSECQR